MIDRCDPRMSATLTCRLGNWFISLRNHSQGWFLISLHQHPNLPVRRSVVRLGRYLSCQETSGRQGKCRRRTWIESERARVRARAKARARTDQRFGRQCARPRFCCRYTCPCGWLGVSRCAQAEGKRWHPLQWQWRIMRGNYARSFPT